MVSCWTPSAGPLPVRSPLPSPPHWSLCPRSPSYIHSTYLHSTYHHHIHVYVVPSPRALVTQRRSLLLACGRSGARRLCRLTPPRFRLLALALRARLVRSCPRLPRRLRPRRLSLASPSVRRDMSLAPKRKRSHIETEYYKAKIHDPTPKYTPVTPFEKGPISAKYL